MIDSIHCFPPSCSKSKPENSAWSNERGEFRIPVLVFGFTAGERRTLAGFRRSYNSTADETMSPGGLYQRLTPTLAAYLRGLVERGLDEIVFPPVHWAATYLSHAQFTLQALSEDLG